MFYHIRITPTGGQRAREDALALDKDAAWIEEHIIAPRREGTAIFVDGRVFTWDGIDEIHITETEQTVEQLIPQARARLRESGLITTTPDKWFVVTDACDVTEQFITGPPGTGRSAAIDKATTFAADRKAVMVIYGHDEEANQALFDWLRAIGLQPQEFTHLIDAKGEGAPYIGDVVRSAFDHVQAVIAFFTPDEHTLDRTAAPAGAAGWRLQSRPNVMIEAGMALVTHPDRTILVVLGTQELPSDLAGRHYIRLDHTKPAPLNDLAQRLRRAGCDTTLTGNDWLKPERFPDRDHLPRRPAITSGPPAALEPNSPAGEQWVPDGGGSRLRPASTIHVSHDEPVEATGTEELEAGPAFTGLWRCTSNGFEASPAMNMVHTAMPGYPGSQSQPPFARFGLCVACDPFPPAASGSKIGAGFVAFLNCEPAISLVSALTHISQTTSWLRLAGNGALRLDAMLRPDGEDARPNASAMLLPPHEGLGNYGRDDRFACLWLHIEPRTPDGTTAQPAGLPQWHQYLIQAIDLATAFAGFLADEAGLATQDNPATRVGVMLQAPNSMNELVDPGELMVLPDAIRSNQFLGYAIADHNGRTSNDAARDLLTLLCDHTMHLADFDQLLTAL